MADKNDIAPIIVKKKKGHPHDAHSSAWKIALADFMTALMCFFLVMWLTSIMNTDVSKEIAKFFDNAGVDETELGVGGILGGQSITIDGPLTQMSAAQRDLPPKGAAEKSSAETLGIYKTPEEIAQEQEAAKQMAQLTKMAQEIQAEIPAGTGTSDTAQSVTLQVRPGKKKLSIDLLESYQYPMFEKGSHKILPHTKEVLAFIGQKLAHVQNRITINGHADGAPYATSAYTNWDLSSDRAHSARRILQKHAPSLNIRAVSGKAATSLFTPDVPNSPVNRRISVVIWYTPDAQKKKTPKTTSDQATIRGDLYEKYIL